MYASALAMVVVLAQPVPTEPIQKASLRYTTAGDMISTVSVGSRLALAEVSVSRNGWRARAGRPFEINKTVCIVPVAECTGWLDGGAIASFGALASYTPSQKYRSLASYQIIKYEVEQRYQFAPGRFVIISGLRMNMASTTKPCRSIGVDALVMMTGPYRLSTLTVYKTHDVLGIPLKVGLTHSGYNNIAGLIEVYIQR